MKFTCAKALLSEAVNNVSPAVASKSSLAALECVFLKCASDGLTVAGYNMELGIVKNVPVYVAEEGTVILNARLFGEIINRMPAGDLTLATDEKLLTIIKGGGAQFTILGMSAEEYPELPSVSGETNVVLSGEMLRSMISQTLYAVSLDGMNPILTGTLFEMKDNVLNLVSVDGYRLALRRETVQCRENFRFVVPGKTLSELLKLISRFSGGEEDAVSIRVGAKHILFECGGYTVISRLLDGEFNDYGAAIPKECKTRVTLSAREFMESINRASIIISDKIKNPVKAMIDGDTMDISCETAMGKVSDTVSVKTEGSPVRIGFNNRYMVDALKASECDELLMEINTPFSPIKLIPLEGDSFIFLVMPMRFKDDN